MHFSKLRRKVDQRSSDDAQFHWQSHGYIIVILVIMVIKNCNTCPPKLLADAPIRFGMIRFEAGADETMNQNGEVYCSLASLREVLINLVSSQDRIR